MSAPPAATPDCRWYEGRGIVEPEDSPALREHLAACQSCRRRRQELEELTSDLRAHVHQHRTGLRPHWQAAVWNRIAAPHRRWLARWTALATGAALAAGAAAILVWIGRSPSHSPPPEPPASATAPLVASLELASDPRDPAKRALEKAGDLIVARVSGIGTEQIEVRVYREGILVAACAGATPPCQRTGDKLEARFKTDRRGRYRAVVVTGDRPLPATTGRYDDDLAALERVGTVRAQRSYDLM